MLGTEEKIARDYDTGDPHLDEIFARLDKIELNGSRAVRVPFTEDGSKSLTLDQATALLCALFADRAVFGYYLSLGVTGEKPRPPGRRERV